MRPWIVVGAGAAVYALVAYAAVGLLPDGDVPTHLTADGTADRFGTAAEVVGLWVGLGAGMVALAVVTVLLAQRGPLTLMSIPNRGYWTAPARIATLRRMLADDMAAVMGVTLAFLALVPIWTTLAATSADGSLAPAALWVPTALYLLGLLVWAGWVMRVRYRRREE